MSVINQNLLLTPEGYQISRSVRLRSSASAYFNRTPASAGNRKTWTISMWMKRGALSTAMVPFQAGSTGSEFTIDWRGFDAWDFYEQTSSTQSSGCTTNAVYRDPSAWYHIVFAYDTTQATSTNRWKLYINGTQVTSFSATQYPTLNYDGYVNNTVAHYIGIRSGTTTPFDGYMTDVNFIDGQALTPSSFGETDIITGVWKPKKYAGTYGTNGFYLNFSDNSNNTATTIGKDSSGNGNNWTPNNISVTSGVTYDSMLDVPTMYADGGNGRGNYCVLNPLKKAASSITVLDGNLGISTSASNVGVAGTIGVSSSKWYWETTFTNSSGVPSIGAASATWDTSYVGYVGSIGYHANGIIYNNGSSVQSSLASYTSGDVIGVALDLDAGSIKFYKNNTQIGTTITGLTGEWFPAVAGQTSSTLAANFGQRPFAYTPPTGFKAMNTQNLPDSTIKKGNAYFDATTYAGNGSSLTISGLGFAPDLVWQKSRSGTGWHNLVDKIRGAGYRLFSNTTNAESYAATNLTAFNSDGFAIGSDGDWNTSGSSNVAWSWKESVSAGFDIVTYTGNGSAGNTFNHSLGVAPSMFIIKGRSGGSAATDYWYVYHKSLGNTYRIYLNTTGASSTSANVCYPSGTSQVYLATGDSFFNASSENYVAYLFAEVAGYSKFGSYTGNGSADGPFVYLGFRPRWLLIKNTGGAASWYCLDSSRNTYNVVDAVLVPNSSQAEVAITSVDFLSNGFKLKTTTTDINGSGTTYIYAAFAENPFKNSLAR